MVCFAREEQDDDSIGTISSSTTISTNSNPQCEEEEEEEQVSLSFEISEEDEQCKVSLFKKAYKVRMEKQQSKLEIAVLIKEAQEELEVVKAENAELHRRILASRSRRRSIVDADMLEGQDFLYQSNLARWVELKDEFDQLKEKYKHELDEMHDKLGNMQALASEQQESLIRDLWQIAREAQNTVTGQILSDVVLDQLEERDRAATIEASKVRIQARQLRSQLFKLESAKRKKDQLPGGLHLVDFEQLKMETESLAEKIGAKNEEISVLRKKRTTVVHSLSHVREKLQHVDKYTKFANDKLESVERDLHLGRIELCNLKARCEQIQRKKGNMQRSMVDITDPLLLEDLENLKEDADATEEILKDLRTRYKGLSYEYRGMAPSKSREPNENKGRVSANLDSDTSSKHDLRWGESRERMWRRQVTT